MSPSMNLNRAHCDGSTSLHLIEIALITRREIVQPHHPLIEPEQRLEQIGADEAGDASDQPDPRARAQLGAHFVVPGH